MTLSTALSDIALALETKLVANQTVLGLKGVFYGDQNLLPSTPIACVEPDTKVITSISAFRKTEIEFTVFIIVYHSAVASPQDNRQHADTLAESIETLLNADKGLLRIDGSARVIHCYVNHIASGYVKKGTSIVRASRITFIAKSQDQLPST